MDGPSVALCGVPAASLFRSLATMGREFDGFIIEEEVLKVSEVRVTGFMHNSTLGTFYSYRGAVNGPQLQQVLALADGAIVGWFVVREGSMLSPTMRDLAVTVSLQQALQQQQALPETAGLLFMAAAWTRDGADSTLTCQQRMYQQSRGVPASLQPVSFSILNLGPWRSRGAYTPLMPTGLAAGEGLESRGRGGGREGGDDGEKGLVGLLQGAGMLKCLEDVLEVEDMYHAAVGKVLDLYDSLDAVEAFEERDLEGEVRKLLQAY